MGAFFKNSGKRCRWTPLIHEIHSEISWASRMPIAFGIVRALHWCSIDVTNCIDREPSPIDEFLRIFGTFFLTNSVRKEIVPTVRNPPFTGAVSESGLNPHWLVANHSGYIIIRCILWINGVLSYMSTIKWWRNARKIKFRNPKKCAWAIKMKLSWKIPN